MTTINLKDFYPWYPHDEYIEVSEEVADELQANRLYEAAYQRRIVRNKAQYSLDCEDGIEYSACTSEPTPQELLERTHGIVHGHGGGLVLGQVLLAGQRKGVQCQIGRAHV